MKTTKKDFETFKKYVMYWQKELGLLEWQIYFQHKSVKDVYANTGFKVSAHIATMEFPTSWDVPVTDEHLKKTALHECMHLVTAPLYVEADDRFTTQTDIDTAEHAIVTRLTNYITQIKGVSM